MANIIGIDSNFQKNLDKFIKKLHKEKPIKFCNFCGRWLYSSQVKYQNISDSEIVIWCKYETQIRALCLNGKGKRSFCSTCNAFYLAKKSVNLFHDIGEIPDEIRNLKDYSHFKQLSLCNFFCNTFQPPKYSYWHMCGQMSIVAKKKEDLRGTFGILLDNNVSPQNPNRDLLHKAVIWLRQHNTLYESYVCNAERIDGYFNTTDTASYYQGFPVYNNDPKTLNIELMLNNKDDTGLIVSVNHKANQTTAFQKNTVQMGISIEKTGENSAKKIHLNIDNQQLEPMIFPHLFPYGKGYWLYTKDGLSQAKYFKMRLLHLDQRFRQDKYYPFFAYDQITKNRLLTVNNMIKSRASLAEAKELENFTKNDYENYYKYGNFVPKTIVGSAQYWKGKYYDLIALTNKLGQIVY